MPDVTERDEWTDVIWFPIFSGGAKTELWTNMTVKYLWTFNSSGGLSALGLYFGDLLVDLLWTKCFELRLNYCAKTDKDVDLLL